MTTLDGLRATYGGDRAGWVYYALSANARTQRIKIGFSIRPRQRMLGTRREGIAVGGQMPTLLAVEPGTMVTERQRHEQFAHLRIVGEWFAYADELAQHIRRLDEGNLHAALDVGPPGKLPASGLFTDF